MWGKGEREKHPSTNIQDPENDKNSMFKLQSCVFRQRLLPSPKKALADGMADLVGEFLD